MPSRLIQIQLLHVVLNAQDPQRPMHPRVGADIDEPPIVIDAHIRLFFLFVDNTDLRPSHVRLPVRLRLDCASPAHPALSAALAPPRPAVEPLVPIAPVHRRHVRWAPAHLAHTLPAHLAPGRDGRGRLPARQARDVVEFADGPAALGGVAELDAGEEEAEARLHQGRAQARVQVGGLEGI